MIRSGIQVLVAAVFVAAVQSGCRGSRLPVLRKAGDFTFVNQEGAAITLARFPGKIKVLSFIYTRCQMATQCPATMRRFRELQQKLSGAGKERTVLLLVSFDPSHDSAAVLKGFGAMYDADFSNWHFLTGDSTVVRQVCDAYQVIAEREEDRSIRHSMVTYLIDGEDTIRKMYIGNDWSPRTMKHHIDALVREYKG